MERQGFRSFAPVRAGEELDVKIEAVGEKGDGIAKVKGFVLFVPGVKEGDEVRIRINKVLRKVGFAEMIGQAQGPVQADTPPKERQSKKPSSDDESEEEASEDNPQEQEEPQQDSEDFGEEEEQ